MRTAPAILTLAVATLPAIAQPVDPDAPPDAVDASLTLDRDAASGPAAAYEPFGRRGQDHWYIATGAAIGLENTEEATDVPLSMGYSVFIADNVEFAADLTLWAHVQEGDDAFGVNPGFNIRWHYINRDDWSLWADAGIGLLFSNDDVPDRGTSFNFTPRLGLGATARITDDLRFIGGVRWHHISNARIEGEERNPDRDGILFFAGVMIPF